MHRAVLIALGVWLAPPAGAAELPAALEAFAGEQSRVCAGLGGAPRVGPAFATAVDLNGDGVLDYVVDLAGIECANAWSAFCGAEGCPLSVWLGGPGGAAQAWDGLAEGWRLEGGDGEMAISVDQRGAACPAGTAEDAICSQRLAFDAPPPALEPPEAVEAELAIEAAPAVPLDAPGGTGWTLRAAPDGTQVAVSDGPGAFSSVAVFCLGGRPWLAATLRAAAAAETAEIAFAFERAAETVAAPARREPMAGGALVIELADRPLAGLLAGRDSAVAVSLDGTDQGEMSLRGSTRAIRGALETCAPG